VPTWTDFPYEGFAQACDQAEPQHYWPRDLLAGGKDQVEAHIRRAGPTMPCVPILTCSREYEDSGRGATGAQRARPGPRPGRLLVRGRRPTGPIRHDAVAASYALLDGLGRIEPDANRLRAWFAQESCMTVETMTTKDQIDTFARMALMIPLADVEAVARDIELTHTIMPLTDPTAYRDLLRTLPGHTALVRAFLRTSGATWSNWSTRKAAKHDDAGDPAAAGGEREQRGRLRARRRRHAVHGAGGAGGRRGGAAAVARRRAAATVKLRPLGIPIATTNGVALQRATSGHLWACVVSMVPGDAGRRQPWLLDLTALGVAPVAGTQDGPVDPPAPPGGDGRPRPGPPGHRRRRAAPGRQGRRFQLVAGVKNTGEATYDRVDARRGGRPAQCARPGVRALATEAARGALLCARRPRATTGCRGTGALGRTDFQQRLMRRADRHARVSPRLVRVPQARTARASCGREA
jgi:hypothetical protein